MTKKTGVFGIEAPFKGKNHHFLSIHCVRSENMIQANFIIYNLFKLKEKYSLQRLERHYAALCNMNSGSRADYCTVHILKNVLLPVEEMACKYV